ncbi:hypothetical protein HK405_001443, partial [Cladochytrium tenue]
MRDVQPSSLLGSALQAASVAACWLLPPLRPTALSASGSLRDTARAKLDCSSGRSSGFSNRIREDAGVKPTCECGPPAATEAETAAAATTTTVAANVKSLPLLLLRARASSSRRPSVAVHPPGSVLAAEALVRKLTTLGGGGLGGSAAVCGSRSAGVGASAALERSRRAAARLSLASDDVDGCLAPD